MAVHTEMTFQRNEWRNLIFSNLIWKDQIPFDLCFSHCHEMNGSDSLCVEIQIHHTWARCVIAAIKKTQQNPIFDLVNISLWHFFYVLCHTSRPKSIVNILVGVSVQNNPPKNKARYSTYHSSWLAGLKIVKKENYHSDRCQPCISCSNSCHSAATNSCQKILKSCFSAVTTPPFTSFPLVSGSCYCLYL